MAPSPIPLPDRLLRALEGRDEVLVTSRDARRQGTVRTWFAVGPPGVVYLLSHAFSLKVERWRSDPWVRLAVPGTGIAAEGEVHVVGEDEVAEVAPLVVERFDMAGAATEEGLRRLLADGTHVLVRVEGRPG